MTSNPHSTREIQPRGKSRSEINKASDFGNILTVESISGESVGINKDEEIITPTFRPVKLPTFPSPLDEDLESLDNNQTVSRTRNSPFMSSGTKNWKATKPTYERHIRSLSTPYRFEKDPMENIESDNLGDTVSNQSKRSLNSIKRTALLPLVDNKNTLRNPNQNNEEEVKDEIYEKRHRPLELVEKRSRKREIELMQYAEHLNRLKKEAPQLWV
jgi:hypothetical protein